jgi:hypothetical protein
MCVVEEKTLGVIALLPQTAICRYDVSYWGTSITRKSYSGVLKSRESFNFLRSRPGVERVSAILTGPRAWRHASALGNNRLSKARLARRRMQGTKPAS